VEEGGQPFQAGLIFVANNAVEEGLFSRGRRSQLDAGILQLFVLKHGTVSATLRAAIAFLRGRTQESEVVNYHRLRSFNVFVKHRKRVRVSCDGETIVLQPPIHYQVVPRALKVRVARSVKAPAT
jgi:diacylglycerol kinase family enzyme